MQDGSNTVQQIGGEPNTATAADWWRRFVGESSPEQFATRFRSGRVSVAVSSHLARLEAAGSVVFPDASAVSVVVRSLSQTLAVAQFAALVEDATTQPGVALDGSRLVYRRRDGAPCGWLQVFYDEVMLFEGGNMVWLPVTDWTIDAALPGYAPPRAGCDDYPSEAGPHCYYPPGCVLGWRYAAGVWFTGPPVENATASVWGSGHNWFWTTDDQLIGRSAASAPAAFQAAEAAVTAKLKALLKVFSLPVPALLREVSK